MALLADPIFLFSEVDREHVEEGGGNKDYALHMQLNRKAVIEGIHDAIPTNGTILGRPDLEG